MQIKLPINELKVFLETNEDAEALAQGEYVVDLYEEEPPITINLRIDDEKVFVLAAAQLLYDEEQDGWYMGERIEDGEEISKAFHDAMRDLQ